MMTLEEFIKSNPQREEIAKQICIIANNNVLNFDETYVWNDLSKLGGFTKEDFWDDKEETTQQHGEEAIKFYGIYNWKLK